ncbi:MAG: PQQ-binding-like beta-propeller repeat protein [Anaerolineae bacterium]
MFPREPAWVFQAAERIITTPVAQNGQIIVRTSEGVYWLNAQGTPLQRVEVSGFTCLNCFNGPPVLCKEMLLVPEGGHSLSVFVVSTGALAWTAIPSANPDGSYVPSNVPVESIACGEQAVYVTRYNWNLTAYDYEGVVLWESDSLDRSRSSLATDGHIVYLGADIYIKAYDGLSGTILWSEKMGAFVRSIQLVSNTLYIGLFEAPFLAMDVDSRTIRWHVDFPAGEYPFLIEGETLYITNQDRLAAISRKDGRILWERRLPEANLGSPVVAKGVLYVRSTRGYLHALEASTGYEVGGLRIQSDGPFSYASDRGPGVAENLLLVPFGDHRLLAYRLIDLETSAGKER